MSTAKQHPLTWQDSPSGELDEDKFIEVVAALAEPTQTVKDAAKATGLPLHTVERVLDRLRSKHPATYAALREFATTNIIMGLKAKMALTLDAMTPEKIAAASYRDQATALGIMLQHHETLQGRPSAGQRLASGPCVTFALAEELDGHEAAAAHPDRRFMLVVAFDQHLLGAPGRRRNFKFEKRHAYVSVDFCSASTCSIVNMRIMIGTPSTQKSNQ